MTNYINIDKKKRTGRNNNQVNPLTIDYATVEKLDFQFINDVNQIQHIDDNLSGLYFAGSVQTGQPSYDLLFLSKDYTISGDVLTFNVDTYTQNYLNKIKKKNTEINIEIGQQSISGKTVFLRDYALAYPRVYVAGLTPAEIDSKDYWTINETKEYVEDKIEELDFVKKSYVDAQDAYLSGQIDLKADESDLTAHTDDTDIHVTSENKSTWNAKQNAITATSKLDYALLSGAPAIPTKTSDLTNDSNFQNATQVNTSITAAVSGKADESDLTAHTSNTDIHVTSENKSTWNAKQNAITATSKLDYALLSGAPAIPTKTSDLTNDSNFQNATQVNTSITAAVSGKITNPSGGTAGQILKKTANGEEWANESTIDHVNVTLETKDCVTAGTFTVDFTGKQIQKYNATNAASGTVTINCTTFTSTANDIAPTVEIQIPINGDVTTITVPSDINVIDMPEKFEYVEGTITYVDLVCRAEKDINGDWQYYLNYAYTFTEVED